jgi:DNA-binding transcriptional regulator YhcF (GntR family)
MYSGIFEPKHYKRIGAALWFFSWCVKSTSTESEEDGVIWGHVNDMQPLKLSELAVPFGVNEKTVSRWIEALEHYDYIRTRRAAYGLIISVRNSKRSDNNVRSVDSDETKMSFHSDGDQTKMSDLSEENGQKCLITDERTDNNVRSKDLINLLKILIDRLIDGLTDERLLSRCGVLTTVLAQPVDEIHLDDSAVTARAVEIESYYNARKGRLVHTTSDWGPVQKVAKMRIPMEFILFGIDLAFARHDKAKKWPEETIQTFSYCSKVINGTWHRLQTELRETANAQPYSTERSDGSSNVRQHRSRQEIQNDEAFRKIREAEERERERSQETVRGYPKLI